jgi:PqqD family protein of HPr-rel-A system
MERETADPRWCAAEDLIWIRYDDGPEWVVFNPASAGIHLLTASARVLWTLLTDEQPHSSEEMATAVAMELGVAPGEELAATLRETVAVMDRAGLLRPYPS